MWCVCNLTDMCSRYARAFAVVVFAFVSVLVGQVAFFMRKGADCLSKWVGEAERQLRLLFEQVGTHTCMVFTQHM